MSEYKFGAEIVHKDSAQFQSHLASSHLSKHRPLCLCTVDGVPMYVAKSGTGFIIKRMPNTGHEHSPVCDSFEPPAEISGAGQVMGNAIQEDPETGMASLKLDFSLSKAGGKKVPQGDGAESDSVESKGGKLSLRGTLHYLWEEAGFNRWSPRMENRRHWGVLYKYLREAAQKMSAKKSCLDDVLYMPEPFSVASKSEIDQRRTVKLEPFRAKSMAGARKLMILVGEAIGFEKARFGWKMTVKHSPDYPFYMDDDLYKALQKRFAKEFELWESHHLMAIGTFSVSMSGLAHLEELSLILVNENWIPFESDFELRLLRRLTESRRHFIKCLRYNLTSKTPLASAVLTDTPKATALYIIGLGDEEYCEAMSNLIANSDIPSWLWDLSQDEVPPLPPISGTWSAPQANHDQQLESSLRNSSSEEESD